MPFSNLFRRKKVGKSTPIPTPVSPENENNKPEEQPKPRLCFQVQLAHGSNTEKIEGFTNVRELYSKIADCFKIQTTEIIFCTLNSHKCDMERLLGGQIGLKDFIFAHIKGQQKEVTLTKTEPAIGLTITDNGTGYPFVKRKKVESVADCNEKIVVGDLIESINGTTTVGCRHYQVAKMLKEIPIGTTFDMTLVEPQKAFDMISQRGSKTTESVPSNANLGTGKATLRLRSQGPATLEALPTESEGKAVKKIDDLLDSFLGIRDMELSSTIWECGKEKKNPDEFVTHLGDQLGDFGFPQEFVFDVWGIILDTRQSNTF